MNLWIAWLLLNCFCVMQFMLQGSVGIMAQSMRHELNLDAAAISLISSSFFYSYVLMQIPVGIIFDRMGIRKTVFYAALLVGISCIAMAFSKTLLSAILIRIVMGIGCAFSFIGLLAGTRLWFAASRFTSLMMLGESLAMIGLYILNFIFSFFIEKTSWQTSIGTFGFFSILIALLMHFYIQATPKEKKTSSAKVNIKDLIWQILQDLKKIITDLRIWLCGLIGGACFSLVTIFIAMWAIPFFRRLYNIDNVTATSLASSIYLGIALGCPFMAYLAKRFQILFIIMFSSLATSLLIGLIIFSPSLPFNLQRVLLLLLGFFLACYQLPFALVGGLVEQRVQGAALGFTNMINMSFAPLFQPLIGLILSASSGGVFDNFEIYDVDSYRQALVFIPLAQLLAFILSFFLYHKIKRNEV